MPRDRYITFHNEPSASSAAEVVTIHQHNFKLMDPSSNSNSRKAIANQTRSKPSRWLRFVISIRRILWPSSKKTAHSPNSQHAQPATFPSRGSFWCCCWCGSSPPPSFSTTTSPEMASSSSRCHRSPLSVAAGHDGGFQRHAKRSDSTPSTNLAVPSIVVHGTRRSTMGGKYWNGDDSFRSNSDRFLETLEQDMEAERIWQRNRGKRPFQVSLLFRGIFPQKYMA